MRKTFFVIALFFSYTAIMFTVAGCGENARKWTVWLADGKSDPEELNLIPAKSPLDNYRENMALIHPWDFGKDRDVNDPTRIKLGEPNVTYIGKWEEYVVYDLTDHENVCKQIMLKDKSGNHKIIYSQLPWCTANVDDLPYIIEMQEIPVLAYRTIVPGNGHFFREYYFIYDKGKKVPVRIDTSKIDPSLIPLYAKDKPDFISIKDYERHRYVADFNFDGIMDRALSEPMCTFGQGGGQYTLYLGNADGSFMELGTVGGRSMSLKRQKHGQGMLYTYWGCGGGCASITEHSISVSGIKKISSKELHVGDYDDSLQKDNDEYERIFNDKDTLIEQISKTSNGNVFWLTPFYTIKSIDKLVSEIVVRAKADDKEAFTVGVPHLDNDLPGDYEKRADKKAQKLIEMILRSDIENNYKQRLEHTSSSKARLNYHYLEKGCHFQIKLEKIEEYGTWYISDIWFCR